MRLYGGRKAIVGYVAPEVHAKIQRVADARRLAIADLVVTATEWLVGYLEAPAGTPELPDVARLGIPPLPKTNDDPSARSGVQADVSLNADDAEPIVSRPRWLFERRAAQATAAKRARRNK
jgi:hypothetical protein